MVTPLTITPCEKVIFLSQWDIHQAACQSCSVLPAAIRALQTPQGPATPKQREYRAQPPSQEKLGVSSLQRSIHEPVPAPTIDDGSAKIIASIHQAIDTGDSNILAAYFYSLDQPNISGIFTKCIVEAMYDASLAKLDTVLNAIDMFCAQDVTNAEQLTPIFNEVIPLFAWKKLGTSSLKNYQKSLSHILAWMDDKSWTPTTILTPMRKLQKIVNDLILPKSPAPTPSAALLSGLEVPPTPKPPLEDGSEIRQAMDGEEATELEQFGARLSGGRPSNEIPPPKPAPESSQSHLRSQPPYPVPHALRINDFSTSAPTKPVLDIDMTINLAIDEALGENDSKKLADSIKVGLDYPTNSFIWSSTCKAIAVQMKQLMWQIKPDSLTKLDTLMQVLHTLDAQQTRDPQLVWRLIGIILGMVDLYLKKDPNNANLLHSLAHLQAQKFKKGTWQAKLIEDVEIHRLVYARQRAPLV